MYYDKFHISSGSTPQDHQWRDKTIHHQDGPPHSVTHKQGALKQLCHQNTSELYAAGCRYSILFENILEGLSLHEIINDDQGKPVDVRFLGVNPSFEKMTGISGEMAVGRKMSELLPNIETFWTDLYATVLASPVPTSFSNYSPLLNKYFEVAAFEVSKKQFGCIFRDISDRVKAQRKTLELENKLRRSCRMEAIGTLAGGIAHDFNNILTAVLGWAHLAQEDIDYDHPVQEKIEGIIKAGERARDLVSHILAYSRKSGDKSIPVPITQITKEAINLLRATIPTSIHLHCSIKEECGTVIGDPVQIHQVLMNLCTNAYHAITDEQGRIDVCLRRFAVEEDAAGAITTISAGCYVLLEVSDTGCGIETPLLAKIFDPFFTTKEVGKGTGMGLSVVQGIVNSLGGTIDVESRPGQGTTFKVYLPHRNVDVKGTQLVAGEIPIRGNARILVVDDDPEITRVTQFRLERLGYRVDITSSSLEAFAMFRNRPDRYDVVITDQTMPGLTGEQLARELLKIRPDIPVILCTGYSALIDEAGAKKAGAKSFLMKPVAGNQLALNVRELLKEHIDIKKIHSAARK